MPPATALPRSWSRPSATVRASGSPSRTAVRGAEEIRPHLFERFARGSGAVGPGLGLTIARAYARAHGGELVHVPGPTGSRFELTVPRD